MQAWQQAQSNPIDIMAFMTHGSLHRYKKKRSQSSIVDRVKASKDVADQQKKGAVFVSPSKIMLSEGRGHIITSYETLKEQANILSHWTPNVFRGGTYYNFKERILKGHERNNLQQINVISFDIDTEQVDPYALFLACNDLGLPHPNVLLKTPRGYQGFFVLSKPFYVSSKTDYKALRVAERLSDNLLHALKTYVPVDTHCVPFGFYRVPNNDNVVYFHDTPAGTEQLLSWSKRYEKEQKRAQLKVIPSGESVDYLSTEWFRVLANQTAIEPGHYGVSRNSMLFTLALACYTSDKSYEVAYDLLDQFNSHLGQPLPIGEFERTIQSAYSGKYQGVKRDYVEHLLEAWTDGSVTFQGGQGWYKFAKPREERQRSHYREWEADILTYLEQHTSPDKPFFEGSLRMLADTFGMAVSTLKATLKRSQKLVKRVSGRGCRAVTKVARRDMLNQQLLRQRQERVQSAQYHFKVARSHQRPKPLGHQEKTYTCDAVRSTSETGDVTESASYKSSDLWNEPVCQYISKYPARSHLKDLHKDAFDTFSTFAPVPRHVPDPFTSALFNRGFKDGRFIFRAWGKVQLGFKAHGVSFQAIASQQDYLQLAVDAVGVVTAEKGDNRYRNFTDYNGFFRYLYGTVKRLVADYISEDTGSDFLADIEAMSDAELDKQRHLLEVEWYYGPESEDRQVQVEAWLDEIEQEQSARLRRRNGKRLFDWLI